MKLTEKQIEIKYARRIFLMLSCAVLAAGTCASALGFHLNVDATAAAQVSAAKPHSVSSKEMAGNLISKVNPKYPDKAKKAHIHGTVVLEATINRKGEVEHLKALSGPEMLQQSALDAVKQWTYKPYLVNGDPVDVETRINVIYSLAK